MEYLLFPPFGFQESCGYRHSSLQVFVRTYGVHFRAYVSRAWNCWVAQWMQLSEKVQQNGFLEWLPPFSITRTMEEGAKCSTCSSALADACLSLQHLTDNQVLPHWGSGLYDVVTANLL